MALLSNGLAGILAWIPLPPFWFSDSVPSNAMSVLRSCCNRLSSAIFHIGVTMAPISGLAFGTV
jgi:hypothetical protein